MLSVLGLPQQGGPLHAIDPMRGRIAKYVVAQQRPRRLRGAPHCEVSPWVVAGRGWRSLLISAVQWHRRSARAWQLREKIPTHDSHGVQPKLANPRRVLDAGRDLQSEGGERPMS